MAMPMKAAAFQPSIATILESAERLVPRLAERAAQTEELRRLPDETVAELVDAGFLDVLKPARFGGPELDFHVAMDVARVLSRGCASSAWVGLVYMLHHWLVGLFPEEAQAEAFASNPSLVPAILNGAGAGATAVPGGYRLAGRWAFGSGAVHSTFAILGANVAGREHDGHPEARLFLVPRREYDLEDTWNVAGLSGTGSVDVIVPETFVPEHRTILATDALEGTAPGGRLHPGTAFRLPALAAFNLAAAAPAVGVAHGAVAAFEARVRTRLYSFTDTKQVENVPAHLRVAEAATDAEVAELLLDRSIRALEEEVAAGRRPSTELRSRCRMHSGYVPRLCKRAVSTVVEAAGAKALFQGAPLGRALRDVTMICSHHTLEYDGGAENYGRVRLGLAPSNPLI